MAETKPRGRAPQDHKKAAGETAADVENDAARDELLADMPALTPPNRLRPRARAALRAILIDATAKGLFEKNEDGEVVIDTHEGRITPEEAEKVKNFDLLAVEVDEFAESIAVDADAYAEWSAGKGPEFGFAILARYQDALGESTGS